MEKRGIRKTHGRNGKGIKNATIKNAVTAKRKNVDTFLHGGYIREHPIFRHIKSLGFEIETDDFIKFTIMPDEETGEEIAVNSALTNGDMEAGYVDEYEFVTLVDDAETGTTFKITNDDSDSNMNDSLNEMYKKLGIKEDRDCKPGYFRLKLNRPSQHMNNDEYAVKFKESDMTMKNCSTFTDTEWIATYLKPKGSANIIFEYFFQTMRIMKQHLSSLKTIPVVDLEYYSYKRNGYKQLKMAEGRREMHVIPKTSLAYYSVSDAKKSDVEFVVQLTFSCDVKYAYKIMYQMLSINHSKQKLYDYAKFREQILSNNSEDRPIVKNIRQIDEFLEDEFNDDLMIVKKVYEFTNVAFKKYNDANTDYPLEKPKQQNQNDQKSDDKKSEKEEKILELKSYLFLILYKVYCYVNIYVPKHETEPEKALLKYTMSYAVRHNNYRLYLEMKKKVREIFDFDEMISAGDITEDDADNEIQMIIQRLVRDSVLSMYIYGSEEVKKIRQKRIREAGDKDELFGDPLVSVKSYFKHFEAELEEGDEEDMRDWLVLNNIDDKSTKFELLNDTTIIEYRMFPLFSNLEIFLDSPNELKALKIRESLLSTSMKIVNKYMEHKNI